MATRYWRTDGSGNWADNANWDDTSSSGAGGASYPVAGDTAIFDRAYTSATCTLAASAYCAVLNMAGSSGITIAGSSNIWITGNITFAAGITWSATGRIYKNGSGTFVSAGITTLARMDVYSSATLTLGDALTMGALYIYGSATLVTNNYDMTTTVIADGGNASATTTLTLGTSTINTTVLSFFNTTTLTITSTDHIINITSDSATACNFAGASWGIVNWKSNASAARAHAITFGSGASFVQFNIDQLTDRRDCSLSFSGDFSLGDSSTWKSGGTGNDDPTYRLLIKSSAIGTTRIVTVSAASKTLTFTDIDLQDIKIADTNSPTVTLTRVGDCGGNTTTTGGGYIKNVSDPKTVYWDAGTNTNLFFYSNYWSTDTDGERDGSLRSSNNFPLPQDTAVFDDYSWDSVGRVVYIGFTGGRMPNINASGLTEANNFVFSTATFYGDVNLSGSGCSISFSSNGVVLTIDARLADTLSLNFYDTNLSDGHISINSYGGTVQLASGCLIGSGTFTLTSGTLDLNGQTLTCSTFSSSNSNTRELKDTAGGGKIIVNGLTGTIFDMGTTTGLTVNNAPDIQVGDGTKTLTADVTFAGGGKTFGDFTIKKHAGNFDCIITEANTFGTLTLETPDATYQYSDLQLTASTTTTVTGLVIDGTADYKPNLSSTTSTHATISDASGENTVTNCLITGVNATGGATFTLSTGASIADDETGWTAPGGTALPVFEYYYQHMRAA